MKVKITLEYEKEVALPDEELWKVYRHSEWVAEVVKALERLDYMHVRIRVEKVDEQEEGNDNAKNN